MEAGTAWVPASFCLLFDWGPLATNQPHPGLIVGISRTRERNLHFLSDRESDASSPKLVDGIVHEVQKIVGNADWTDVQMHSAEIPHENAFGVLAPVILNFLWRRLLLEESRPVENTELDPVRQLNIGIDVRTDPEGILLMPDRSTEGEIEVARLDVLSKNEPGCLTLSRNLHEESVIPTVSGGKSNAASDRTLTRFELHSLHIEIIDALGVSDRRKRNQRHQNEHKNLAEEPVHEKNTS